MQFRKDINGLRALAVIAVVLFHFNESWMPGGFAGVDVFFVISGFLMTGIIFRGIEQDNFSIFRFYVARANRIIPALAALCLVLLVFGWFYLTPLDYKALGKHVVSSMGFFSNFTYWKESGYFDAASHEKWLLHTWSLSAEWQFYIIYPLILVIMRKFMSLKSMKVTVLAGTVLGFIYCVIATYKWPNSSYYLLPTRAWGMMIGGVAYLYPLKLEDNKKKFCEWLGLALIFVSYIFISKENLWPGYLALIPVLGAFLIIQAQRNDSIITGNVISQNLGKWSYSIYLWHWPFVVIISYFTLNSFYTYLGIMLSIIFGYASYKYIESIKFKNDFYKFNDYFKCGPIYIFFIASIIGYATFKTDGFKWHYSNKVIQANEEINNKSSFKCTTEDKSLCYAYVGNKNNIKAVIVGDSHADALTTSLANAFNLEHEGIVAITKSGCPFILGAKSTILSDEACLFENVRRVDFLKKNFTDVPIFWVARTPAYLYGQSDPARIKDVRDTQPLIYFTKKYINAEPALISEFELHLNKTIDEISFNRAVFLVLPTPEMRWNIPKKMSRDMMLERSTIDYSIDKKTYLERNKNILDSFDKIPKNNANVKILDPTNFLCENNRCIAQVNGRPIYFDSDHLSEYGNKILTPMFKETLRNLRENTSYMQN